MIAFHRVHQVLGMASPATAVGSAQQTRKRPSSSADGLSYLICFSVENDANCYTVDPAFAVYWHNNSVVTILFNT